MKRSASLCLFAALLPALLLTACAPCETATYGNDTQAASADALCRRILGKKYSKSFIFKTIPPEGENCDLFRVSSSGGRVVVEGNNANSMAVGLNWYLKYRCNVSFGFSRPEKVKLPEPLPLLPEPVKVNARCRQRFFLNYCTFGYSMPWWHWEDWEYFIDWMAMNGVNLPLSITGQEAIWYRIWTQMGLSDDAVRSYFTGPAHLPWHRMLNIDEWGGPLPHSWLVSQEELQKKIVAREREYGMKTVLPGFSGHVPESLSELYPDARIDRLCSWGGFSEEEACFFLDPMDSLFSVIQNRFIREQTDIYGTDHIYGIDLFNEIVPPSWEPEYLARVGRQVYGSLAAADSCAVWLQMAWLFYNDRYNWTDERVKAYITSYPADRSILLDYYCDKEEVWRRSDKFCGVPFIWCYLGNFGGNAFLAGNLPQVNGRIERCCAEGALTGIGSTLESLDVCNQWMYDFVLEKAWNIPEVTGEWENYAAALADRRCGKVSECGRKAWKILLDEVYSSDYATVGRCTKVNVRPTFGTHRTKWSRSDINYDNERLREALSLLLEADCDSDSYLFDIVNLARQWLGNRFGEVFARYEDACASSRLSEMDSLALCMEGIIADLDEVLSCRSEFLLGKWLKDAASFGVDEAERTYYESNARNLITTWGRAQTALNDYASRDLAGLTSSYYGVRWKMFFDSVRKAVSRKGTFTEEDYQAFWKEVNAFEDAWWRKCPGTFLSSPSGDAKTVVRRVMMNKP